MDLNRFEEAYRDFDKTIALSPSFGPAYSNRANAAQKLQRLEAAENDFRKAIELMPAKRRAAQRARQDRKLPGPLLHGPALSQPGHRAERAIHVRLPEPGRGPSLAEPERGGGAGFGQGHRARSGQRRAVYRARKDSCRQTHRRRHSRISRKALELSPTMCRR